MQSIKTVTRYIVALVLAMLLLSPSLINNSALASLVSERSITMSSSSVSATNVKYKIDFVAVGQAGAITIDFCKNSPVFGQDCDALPGFSVDDATTSTPGFSIHSAANNRLVINGAVTESSQVTVEIEGVNNPSQSGTFYARIATYDTAINAANAPVGELGDGSIDEGGIAMAITPTIGVSGVVPETMTFCVSAEPISANCNSVEPPTLRLGEDIGNGIIALVPGQLSEGDIYTQLSTNAINGGVIRLKSNAVDCGGLIRAGAPTACDIGPAGSSGIQENSGQALFGVKTAEATDSTGVDTLGQLRPAEGSIYNNDNFALNFVAGNGSGVTSTYGDPFLDTAGAPVNNKNMRLTFGVYVTNDTPAGDYSAQIGLIATGRF